MRNPWKTAAGAALATLLTLPAGPATAGKAYGNGASCRFNSDCASDRCSSGTCRGSGDRPALANGTRCSYSGDCASGRCYSGVCDGGYPRSYGNGASCSYNSDCASGRCSSGVCSN